jgi:hypothetical protein
MCVRVLARQIIPPKLTNLLRRENGQFVPIPALPLKALWFVRRKDGMTVALPAAYCSPMVLASPP